MDGDEIEKPAPHLHRIINYVLSIYIQIKRSLPTPFFPENSIIKEAFDFDAKSRFHVIPIYLRGRPRSTRAKVQAWKKASPPRAQVAPA